MLRNHIDPEAKTCKFWVNKLGVKDEINTMSGGKRMAAVERRWNLPALLPLRRNASKGTGARERVYTEEVARKAIDLLLRGVPISKWDGQ